MPLPTLQQLGTVYRGNPCAEFPGTYFIYHNGKEIAFFSGEVGETEARKRLRTIIAEDDREGTFALAWGASDNDPRIGQVWFTGFYALEKVEI